MICIKVEVQVKGYKKNGVAVFSATKLRQSDDHFFLFGQPGSFTSPALSDESVFVVGVHVTTKPSKTLHVIWYSP